MTVEEKELLIKHLLETFPEVFGNPKYLIKSLTCFNNTGNVIILRSYVLHVNYRLKVSDAVYKVKFDIWLRRYIELYHNFKVDIEWR